MWKILSLLLALESFIYCVDDKENIKFNKISYPISAEINTIDKSDILFETPLSKMIEQKFNRVVLQGEVNDKNIEFQLYVTSPSYNSSISSNTFFCSYTGFSKIYPNGRFWVKFDIDKETHYLKLVVVNRGVKVDKFKIKIYEFQVLNVNKKKENETMTSDVSTTNYSLGGDLPFKLIRRDEWKANPPTASYIPHTPMRITIHHTAAHYPTTYDEAISEIQFIQDYHQNAKGWIDIGYHFLIDPLGNIFEGRPVMVVGAHVAGKNTNNVGISIMGNYHPPVNNELTQKTIDSIITLIRYLKDKFNIPKNEIYGHRDFGPTDCPGDIIYSKIPEIKNSVYIDTIPAKIDLQIDNKELREKILKSIDW
jgi:hypothetical protein